MKGLLTVACLALVACASAQTAGEPTYRAREAEAALARARAAQQAEAATNRRLAEEVQRLQAQVRDLETRPTERGWRVTLGSDLLFEPGNTSLTPAGRRVLADLADIVRKDPERNIVIEGFTDSTGHEAANQRLSELRAEAVRGALVSDGVAPERIVARGLGGAFPIASNASPGGRRRNARVEILIGERAGRAAVGGANDAGR